MFLTDPCVFSHCFVRVVFKAPHCFKCASKRNLQPSVVIYNLLSLQSDLPSNLSSLSLHFSQLKIAIMDISSQVSFDFHSLFCHLFSLILPLVLSQLSSL